MNEAEVINTETTAPETTACPSCGSPLLPGAQFCAMCGARLSVGKSACKGCGQELTPGVRFCPRCGAPAGEEPRGGGAVSYELFNGGVYAVSGDSDDEPRLLRIFSREELKRQQTTLDSSDGSLYVMPTLAGSFGQSVSRCFSAEQRRPVKEVLFNQRYLCLPQAAGGWLYFCEPDITDASGGRFKGGGLCRVKPDTGERETLVESAQLLPGFTAIAKETPRLSYAVDGDTLYWSSALGTFKRSLSDKDAAAIKISPVFMESFQVSGALLLHTANVSLVCHMNAETGALTVMTDTGRPGVRIIGARDGKVYYQAGQNGIYACNTDGSGVMLTVPYYLSSTAEQDSRLMGSWLYYRSEGKRLDDTMGRVTSWVTGSHVFRSHLGSGICQMLQ